MLLREIGSPRDLLLLLRVFSMAALVPLLMRLPLPRLLAWLTPAPRREVDRVRSRKVLAFMRSYMRLFRHRLRNPCLVRGVTLYHFLRLSGQPVRLHFGIRPRERLGHCWVTLEGRALLEPGDPERGYLEMYSYPDPEPIRKGGERA